MQNKQRDNQGVVIDILDPRAEQDIYNTCIEHANSFISRYGFDSIVKLSQSQFNACLSDIYHSYISREYDFRYSDHRYNMYDIDKLNVMYRVYKRLCDIYDKAITLNGFCCLTGVDDMTIRDFSDTTGKWGGRKVTTESLDFIKRLTKGQENSLREKLITGKTNPVGVIALLNHDHGYATQTVRHEISTSKQDLDAIASAVGVMIEQKT